MKKNIFNLSRIFIKESNKNFDVIVEGKLNKKSTLFWIILILFIGISYISYEVIHYLVRIGKPEIFLNGFSLFIEILLIMQSAIICTNIFYISKDIDSILPLPFKPIEILISKFNTMIFMLYGTELVFALVPFAMYGIYAEASFMFLFNLVIGLIVFPIFISFVVSSFMLLFINLFKNKDLMQFIVTGIVLLGIMFLLNYSFKSINIPSDATQDVTLNIINEKIISVNKYFLTLNEITNIMQQQNWILSMVKIILYNVCGGFVFVFLGNKIYLKQLIKSKTYSRNKGLQNFDKKIKKRKISDAYIKKEFKQQFKNPIFFLQNVYPVILITIVVSILLAILIPKATEFLTNVEEYKEQIANLKFDFEAVCIILGLVQVVGLFNYCSITAFSKDGKDAYIFKSFPIDLFKQFYYKNITQIVINTFCSIIILWVIRYEIPAISLLYMGVIFVLSTLMTIINSFILSLIDLINPKLNWEAEYEIAKNNKNKLLQYVLLIFNVLFLIYFENVLRDLNLNISICIFFIILLIIFAVLSFYIRKFKNKLWKKID